MAIQEINLIVSTAKRKNLIIQWFIGFTTHNKNGTTWDGTANVEAKKLSLTKITANLAKKRSL